MTYLQQRQAMKLKGGTKLTPRAKEAKELKIKVSSVPEKKKCKDASKKKVAKRIKKRTKKQAKKMRQLGKINKEILGDMTSDIKLPCAIGTPVCTHFATVLNHDKGRDGDQLTRKEDMTPCCPPCNGYIEAHHEWARERGFKRNRHGAVVRNKFAK